MQRSTRVQAQIQILKLKLNIKVSQMLWPKLEIWNQNPLFKLKCKARIQMLEIDQNDGVRSSKEIKIQMLGSNYKF